MKSKIRQIFYAMFLRNLLIHAHIIYEVAEDTCKCETIF